MEDNTSNFIDFIGVERFDAIIDSYLINIVNCMKIKEKKNSNFSIDNLQVWKVEKKKLKYTKYLFTLRTSFQISNINSRTRFFQVEGV